MRLEMLLGGKAEVVDCGCSEYRAGTRRLRFSRSHSRGWLQGTRLAWRGTLSRLSILPLAEHIGRRTALLLSASVATVLVIPSHSTSAN